MRSSRWRTLLDGRALVLVVVGGGLLTLQSSDNLDPVKVAYLALAALAVVGATAGARWWLSNQRGVAMPWLISAATFVALVVISLAASRVRGTAINSWLRDAATYGLFAAAPILGLACARSASRRWIIAVWAICGALASISFAIEWLGRRAIVDLPIDRLVLPSGGLGSALLALATGLALAGGGRKWWWVTLAGAILGLFFVTGTRSTLLLLAIPLGAGVLAGRPWRPSAQTLIAQGVVAVCILVAADAGISVMNGTLPLFHGTVTPPSPSGSPQPPQPPQPTQPPNKLGERVIDVGTLVTNPGSDLSLQERLAQTRVAWQAFTTSPLVGVGPGYGFVWTNSEGSDVNAFTLDTPLVYLAKFGLLGLVPLILFAVAYLRLTLALWSRRTRFKAEFLTAASFGIALLVGSILGAPMEDKGVSFALVFVVGMCCRALINVDHEESIAAISPAPATG